MQINILDMNSFLVRFIPLHNLECIDAQKSAHYLKTQFAFPVRPAYWLRTFSTAYNAISPPGTPKGPVLPLPIDIRFILPVIPLALHLFVPSLCPACIFGWL